ncbi:hypothetical protein D9Q98_006875 [Chlorella vulgaris]|uniref:OTU domain-containing protein n=1 Tax=Chlorella vulgaris TaxID=3077 RepID=A0A9D4TJ54_CHLVU|nr:hypothetical protein D9Q98_006875 [Chlorella vulgaris]
MVCCGGDEPEDYVPAVRYDEASRSEAEDLRGRLSAIMPPLDADWQSEATVNLSGRPSATPGTAFERRQSMRLASGASLTSGGQQAQQGPGCALQWTESRKLLEAAIAMEQLEPAVPPTIHEEWSTGRGWAGVEVSAVQAEEARLQQRLWKLKLEHYVMEGDGNCQFRAVSFGLYGTQKHHGFVRRKAVEYIQQQRQDFEAFLGEDFGSYVRHMSRLGTWGDELTLRASCEALGLVINSISSDAEHWFVRHIPRTTRPEHEIFITYIAPLHFNAIRRQNTGTRLRQSFGRQQGSQLTRAVSSYQRRFGIPETPHHVVHATMGG